MEFALLADLYQAADLNKVDLSSDAQFVEFKRAASQGNLVPLYERIFSDQLTPVVAYRCLVEEDDHDLPSFLFESVVNGDQQVGPHMLLLLICPVLLSFSCTLSSQLTSYNDTLNVPEIKPLIHASYHVLPSGSLS